MSEDSDSGVKKFPWPPQYDFPPFFTIQPNTETRKKQLEIWSKLILRYCKRNRIFILEKANTDTPLFHNADISRQLSVSAVETILENMKKNNQIEWVDSKMDRCFVYWRSPADWGTLIYSWAQSNGLLNTVETFFEILNAKTEFKGMDMPMLIQCLKTLVASGKAEILGNDGVKFF